MTFPGVSQHPLGMTPEDAFKDAYQAGFMDGVQETLRQLQGGDRERAYRGPRPPQLDRWIAVIQESSRS